MDLRGMTMHVQEALFDEQLIRLLYYSPPTTGDNPLDENKSDILTLPKKEKWEIINNHIMSAPKFDDMEKNEVKLSRLIFYAGDGKSAKSNYLYSNQQFNFDVFTHYTIENIDKRLEWICDRINEIFYQKAIDGIGKTNFIRRHPINAPKGYVGYRVIYELCLEQY